MSVSTTAAPFTIRDLVPLQMIAEAAQEGQSVAFLAEDNTPRYGTARSIGDENGYFARGEEDVRDLFLRVTMRSGVERYERVGDLMEQLHKTFFTNVHE